VLPLFPFIFMVCLATLSASLDFAYKLMIVNCMEVRGIKEVLSRRLHEETEKYFRNVQSE
jgi:hypothetical protein